MTVNPENLKQWLEDMSAAMERNEEPDPQLYAIFLQEPELALNLLEIIEELDDGVVEEDQAFYSACVFALDICVAQLQAALENGSKSASKAMNLLMFKIAQSIDTARQGLNFWAPVLNAFYEVHVELSDELKQSYLDLSGRESELSSESALDHLNSIRDVLAELSDLSVFDIAENFFAQCYAMPADFFMDLILDLYSIEEGQDIALLTLLHPDQEVRDVVLETFLQVMPQITLSSISLSRLQVIKNWYPLAYQEQFNEWIKIQRKKGVVFKKENPKIAMHIKASEVDGSGAQGIFIQIKEGRKSRLCGLLFKQGLGIKDAWVTPLIQTRDVSKYYDEAFSYSVSLREIDEPYLLMMIGHFLALTIENNSMPGLHLLEMQEILGLQFHPEAIDLLYLLDNLSVQITPFTAEAMQSSFQRSKKWPNNKRFTDSWFVENAHVDKLVNRYCSFVEGAKICAIDDAMAAVFAEEFEKDREKWLFHFLWTALWARVKPRKTEKIWQDCFFIAYAIHTGQALTTIPIMNEICKQTVLNSIDTMQERRTYLTKE